MYNIKRNVEAVKRGSGCSILSIRMSNKYDTVQVYACGFIRYYRHYMLTCRLHDRRYMTVLEGKLRYEELLTYLKDRDFPSRVSLSEHATRIQATVCYDPKTNQMVGFSLPFDENELPTPFSYMARDTKEIGSHFKKSTSSQGFSLRFASWCFWLTTLSTWKLFFILHQKSTPTFRNNRRQLFDIVVTIQLLPQNKARYTLARNVGIVF